MKKRMLCLCLALCMVWALAACNGTVKMNYTFRINNGDEIKVSVNVADGFKLTSDVPFSVMQNDETLSQGTFIQGDAYESYVAAAEGDENAVILDRGEKDGNEYVFWSYNDEEFNYVILVGDSETAVILANAISQESAEECFAHLSFEED